MLRFVKNVVGYCLFGGVFLHWRVHTRKTSCGTHFFDLLIVTFLARGHISEKFPVVPVISKKAFSQDILFTHIPIFAGNSLILTKSRVP